MSLKIVRNYVNGQWIEAESRSLLDVKNPSTVEIMAGAPLSSKVEADRAIEAAAAVFGLWSTTPVAWRVNKLASLVDENVHIQEVYYVIE